MTEQPILIDGAWQPAQAPAGSFTAMNPATGKPLPERYPVSTFADLDRALRAAQEAVAELRSCPVESIADFLERFAGAIEDRAGALVEMAHLETALPVDARLRNVELPRTTNQLRQAAAAARDRSWCHATIDRKANIRSKFAPLSGPVVVFGPNNFPFAFNSAAGGDFAAAIAAGNPVIAKANTGHPGTTRLLAEVASEALQGTGLPRAMVQLVYRMSGEDGFALVGHPLVGASAFTGSRSAGLRLKAAADRAGKPIYLEMSSINPVVILPGALEERAEEIAGELSASCLAGVGQFCTNPGLMIVLRDPAGEAFVRMVAERFEAAGGGVLLSDRGPQDIAEAIGTMQQNGAEVVTGGHAGGGPGFYSEPSLLRVDGAQFLEHPEPLQTEAFGHVSLVVLAEDTAQLVAIIEQLDGNLTGAIYSDRGGADDPLYDRIEPLLRTRVGRLLNDKVPTGVAVSPAMVHGGPYPATGHPGFTAVGIPAALVRFAALQCYDNVRPHRLPPELQDANPTGSMWRLIDGAWTQA